MMWMMKTRRVVPGRITANLNLITTFSHSVITFADWYHLPAPSEDGMAFL